MKIQSIHIGMQVKHPQYGNGIVRGIAEHTVDVVFDDGKRIIDPEAAGLEAAEAQVSVSGLDRPFVPFIDEIISRTVDALGFEKPDASVPELGARWHNGKVVLHPPTPRSKPKKSLSKRSSTKS